MVFTDNIAYAKFRKTVLSWQRIRSSFVIFALPTMCRASEGLKIEVFKYAYRNIWNKNQNSIAKKAQCWFLKFRIWNFDVSRSTYVEKKITWFFHWKTPLTFFSQKDGWAMFIFNFLLLRPSTLVLLQTDVGQSIEI